MQTPLHIAAQSGHVHICYLLLMNGADPTIRNSTGCTPAQVGTESVQKVFQGESLNRTDTLMLKYCQKFFLYFKITL